jgi:two-component system, NtrC family, sensor kinase
LKLATKLTLYLSLIIILVLSGYGYFDILSRRDILIRKMRAEVRSAGRILKLSLEKISLPEEAEDVRGLIKSLSEDQRMRGIVVYYPEKNNIFCTHSLEAGVEPYLDLIKRSIREDRPQEEFGTDNKNVPIFSYAFPLKDPTGKIIGGLSILEYTSFMEKEIEQAKWNMLIMTALLIGGMVTLILLGTRRWVTRPISRLIDGTRKLARGNLDHHLDWQSGDELSELAQAFNQMAADLKRAQERIIQEGEAKLELERSLRQSEKLATIGQLASGLAHEVGTPLNIIIGRAEMMKKKAEDREEIQKNSDTIVHQGERITRIIQQLLDLVRKKRPERKPLQVDAILESILDFLDHQIEKQNVKVEKNWRENIPPVSGDPDQLQQVFLNLILNAIQSMPKGGTLRLSASPKQITIEGLGEEQRHLLEVGVEDTGVGMEREVIQNIFNPFFTTKETGTGLGLMVTQGIVRDHEGWITVESEIGKGSWFKVYLPVWPGEGKSGRPEP